MKSRSASRTPAKAQDRPVGSATSPAEGNAFAQEQLAAAPPSEDLGFLEAAFGSHRLGDVPVDASGEDPRLTSLGTEGVAEDGEIAVTPDADRHVLAHEAAHVVQQEEGVPTDAFGGAEGHANAVADAVVSGQSAEPLLDACEGSPGVAAGPQPYTEDQHGKTSNGDDQVYRVDGDDLQATDDEDLPADFTRADGDGYQDVSFDGDYINDCLTFAENLAVGIDGRDADGRTQFRAEGDANNRLFGHSDDNNKAIAGGDWDVGTNAAPGVGDAYGICRSGDEYGGDDTLKYHAATVIDIDGTDRITAEADASDVMRDAPAFDMYGTADGQTFQDRHEGGYGTHTDADDEETDAEFGTGVLRLRTDDVTYPGSDMEP